MLGMPIIFAYYHLMNVVLVLNIGMLVLLPSLFRNFMTNIPVVTALFLFMGLREVSLALSDPFGMDTLDLPVTAFLNTTFDRCACVLEAFATLDCRDRIRQQIPVTAEFSDVELRRSCK